MADWVDVAGYVFNFVFLLVGCIVLYFYMRRKEGELAELKRELAVQTAPDTQQLLEAYRELVSQTTIEARTAARILERTRSTMRRGIKG
jgi:hypothetical protein